MTQTYASGSTWFGSPPMTGNISFARPATRREQAVAQVLNAVPEGVGGSGNRQTSVPKID
jgi:hypothetical protein